jgi:hypothetical protein
MIIDVINKGGPKRKGEPSKPNRLPSIGHRNDLQFNFKPDGSSMALAICDLM